MAVSFYPLCLFHLFISCRGSIILVPLKNEKDTIMCKNGKFTKALLNDDSYFIFFGELVKNTNLRSIRAFL